MLVSSHLHLQVFTSAEKLFGEMLELPESGDAKNEKVGGENSIDQVLGEELEQQEQRQKHSTPHQRVPHRVLLGHSLLHKKKRKELIIS